MLKSLPVLMHQERERPGTADWWIEQEDAVTARCARDGDPKLSGARFVTEYSYRQMQEWAHTSPPLTGINDLPAIGDCTAGPCAVDDNEPDPDAETMTWLVAYREHIWREGTPVLTPAVQAEPATDDHSEGMGEEEWSRGHKWGSQ